MTLSNSLLVDSLGMFCAPKLEYRYSSNPDRIYLSRMCIVVHSRVKVYSCGSLKGAFRSALVSEPMAVSNFSDASEMDLLRTPGSRALAIT